MNPIILDERLSAAAELAREALAGREAPVAADVGCDHGFLTAKLLETVPGLTMLASDVSAPSICRCCAAGWPNWALRFKRRSTAARRGGTTSRCWRGRARPKCRTSGG